MSRPKAKPSSPRCTWVAFAVALACSHASPAFAQAPTSVAEQLFVEGRALMKRGEYELACEKFKASYALDLTAYGTLFNLALCHEQTGKPASAWAEFRAVASASVGVRDDRATAAREHEAKLRPLLSYLTVEVKPDVRTEGLRIRVDQSALEPGAWNTEFPVDPGSHVVEASAPGKVTGKQTIAIGAQADHKRLTIARLIDAPAAPSSEDRRRPTQWFVGLGVGATGVVAMGIGAGLGFFARAEVDDAQALCAPDGTCRSAAVRDEATRKHEAGADLGNVGTVVAAGGALLAGTGLVLMLTSRSPSRGRVTAAPTRGGAALQLEGTF